MCSSSSLTVNRSTCFSLSLFLSSLFLGFLHGWEQKSHASSSSSSIWLTLLLKMAYVLGHNIHDASNVALPTDLPVKVSLTDHWSCRLPQVGVIPCSQAYVHVLTILINASVPIQWFKKKWVGEWASFRSCRLASVLKLPMYPNVAIVNETLVFQNSCDPSCLL